MRSLATTTAKGVARVIDRPRLRTPRHRPQGGALTEPPTAARLAHIAHITPLDGTISPVPNAALEDLLSPASPSTTTSTPSMQSAAATVGA